MRNYRSNISRVFVKFSLNNSPIRFYSFKPYYSYDSSLIILDSTFKSEKYSFLIWFIVSFFYSNRASLISLWVLLITLVQYVFIKTKFTPYDSFKLSRYSPYYIIIFTIIKPKANISYFSVYLYTSCVVSKTYLHYWIYSPSSAVIYWRSKCKSKWCCN